LWSEQNEASGACYVGVCFVGLEPLQRRNVLALIGLPHEDQDDLERRHFIRLSNRIAIEYSTHRKFFKRKHLASTKDIAKGHVLLGGDTILPLEPDAENPPFGSASITIKNDSFYSIRIEDSDGYANKDPISRTITALPDRKPVIRFTHDRKEITAAPGDTLKLALRAADDYGLSEVAIFFQDAEDAPIRRLRDWPGLRR